MIKLDDPNLLQVRDHLEKSGAKVTLVALVSEECDEITYELQAIWPNGRTWSIQDVRVVDN